MVRRFARVGLRFGARMGVRARSALVAVVVVSAALLVGGTGLVFALKANLEHTAETVARDRAGEVVALIREDGVAETADGLIDESRSGQLVQILRADGEVVGFSNRLVASQPMSAQRPPVGAYASEVVETDFLGDGGDWKVVSTAVKSRSATYVVQVAVPIHVQRETVQTVTVFLLAATPLLLAGVGLAVWLLVGRALRSVERIRAAVAGIDARRLAARVEVPPTRDEIAALAADHECHVGPVGAVRSSPARVCLRRQSRTPESARHVEYGSRARRRRRRVQTDPVVGHHQPRADAGARPGREPDDPGPGRRQRSRGGPHRGGPGRSHRRRECTGCVPPATNGRRRSSYRFGSGPIRSGSAQALRNLVDNAERYARTTVRMTLHSKDDQAVIWVDNDGPVIDDADRERIFERFVRLDDSRSRDAGGSGLGLAIARTGLQACGGDVSVVDTPDGWCRFEMRIPIPGPAAASPRSAPAQASSGKLQTSD